MRLTQKHDFFKYVLPEYNYMGDNQASEIQLEETDYTCKKYIIGNAIRQFGLIEDVLEKHKVESAEELDLILQELKDVHQENANLKNELAELKQKVKENRQHAEFWQSAYKRCIDREEKSQKQLAISELEQLKEKLMRYSGTILNKDGSIKGYSYVIKSEDFEKKVDTRIKELGGGDNDK